MQMEKGLDTGDILLSETVDIRADDTAASLSQRLSQTGAGLWPRGLAALSRGGLTPTPQAGEPSYAHKINKDEARIDWSRPAKDLDCHIRGLSPFPGAWTTLDGKRVKILLSETHPQKSNKPADFHPGKLFGSNGELGVACNVAGEDILRILSLQPAGKSAMSGQEFIRGYLENGPKAFE